MDEYTCKTCDKEFGQWDVFILQSHLTKDYLGKSKKHIGKIISYKEEDVEHRASHDITFDAIYFTQEELDNIPNQDIVSLYTKTKIDEMLK